MKKLVLLAVSMMLSSSAFATVHGYTCIMYNTGEAQEHFRVYFGAEIDDEITSTKMRFNVVEGNYEGIFEYHKAGSHVSLFVREVDTQNYLAAAVVEIGPYSQPYLFQTVAFSDKNGQFSFADRVRLDCVKEFSEYTH